MTVTVKCQPTVRAPLASASIGIDLGQRTLMNDSNGEAEKAQRIYRKMQEQLAVAQRARKKQRVKALHA